MQMDKFTHKSQAAIQAAQGLAYELGHQEIQPEHLLKVLVAEPEGVVVPVLQKIGVAPATLLAEADQLLARLPKVSGGGFGQVALAAASHRLLEKSFKIAAGMHDEYVSQEHIFLALLEERETPVVLIPQTLILAGAR